jgi:bifunctional non-homologous end joining protein LigD
MVEDHPFDYRKFEGIIPEGNYGAGTVEIWDKGTYTATNANGDSGEKELLKELKAGNLKITMNGKYLKGEFALVKLKNGKQENAWLLIKHRDEFAVEKEYTSEDYKSLTKLKGKTFMNEKKKKAKEPKATSKKSSASSKTAATSRYSKKKTPDGLH